MSMFYICCVDGLSKMVMMMFSLKPYHEEAGSESPWEIIQESRKERNEIRV